MLDIPSGLQLQIQRHAGTTLAVLVSPGGQSVVESAPSLLPAVEQLMSIHGGVLLRGFDPPSVEGFQAVATTLAGDLLHYDFASTPRSKVAKGVYTSTEYPADQWIPQHNEQSYTLRWPLRICFFCSSVARVGGETPLTDSRTVFDRIDPAIRRQFAERKLMYVRNYGNGLDLTWETAFGTRDRSEVERFCRDWRIIYEWLDGGRLRTRQICQGVARHPTTGEIVWFNQAHLFHVSGLQPEVREALLEIVDEDNLPRNVYYGDGTPLDVAMLDSIRQELIASLLPVEWQSGDVLLLDNMLMAHGRAPFEGPREILVAMGGAHSGDAGCSDV